MDKLEDQIAEIFSKPGWTEQDWQTIRKLLEQVSPGSMQSFFQENYISELAKGVQQPSDKARYLLEQIHHRAGIEETIAPVISIKRRNHWSRIAVAASILIVIGISSYFLFFNKPAVPEQVVQNNLPNDIKAPETNRAMITLADGRTVYLDSALNGQLAMQGNIKLIKLADGQIAYQTATGEVLKEIQYNTLTNPRGSLIIDMTLADGSRVWLNAGSSVTYPVAFVGTERTVSITGEAYFEVAKNENKKFFVESNGTVTEVLGTHFNVNAYDDEENIKVTLLEGSVKVSTGKQGTNSTILKPGQSAFVTNFAKATSAKKTTADEAIQVKSNVDIEAVMAWKNGFFSFHNADIPTVMRQLSRWYDVKVKYTNGIPKREFEGYIDRSLSLAKVLTILEKMNVRFRIDENKTIEILP